METLTPTITKWKKLTEELGKSFADRAGQLDKEGTFVFENYEELKARRYFSAAIPEELGGGGMSHAEMCQLIRQLAHSCSSTALAFSMHQHLVAAAVWKYKHRGESAPLLQRIANEQLVMVSTGAKDWLESNGEMTRTENGYHFTAQKQFASQSVAGNMVVTSAPYLHPRDGWQVLHFALPFLTEGISLKEDWDVLGMRSTGSQTIVFDRVFVPDSAISLVRPRSGFPPVWDLVLTIAMPLIMSAYVGIAEDAVKIALVNGRKKRNQLQHLPYLIGKMNNSLVSAKTQWNAMITLTNSLDFMPNEKTTVEMLSLKTNVAAACMQTVQEAMEISGGQSFYKSSKLERLFRDVQAARFHPLPAWEQYGFTGERLLVQS